MEKGFTLIEIVVVIAIFSMIAVLGLFMTLDTFRGTQYRSERDTVVAVLEKARSRAMANINQTAWGVYYDSTSHSYIIFRGTTYDSGASTNEAVPGNAAVTITGLSSSGVVFSQLTGNTTATTVTVTQDARTSSITINNEGTILW